MSHELDERPSSDGPSFILNKCICTDSHGGWRTKKRVPKKTLLTLRHWSIRFGDCRKRKELHRIGHQKGPHRSRGDWQK